MLRLRSFGCDPHECRYADLLQSFRTEFLCYLPVVEGVSKPVCLRLRISRKGSVIDGSEACSYQPSTSV